MLFCLQITTQRKMNTTKQQNDVCKIRIKVSNNQIYQSDAIKCETFPDFLLLLEKHSNLQRSNKFIVLQLKMAKISQQFGCYVLQV